MIFFFLYIPVQNERFRGYTGITLSLRLFMCPSVYKILVSVKAPAGVLTLYYTIPTFNDPEKVAFFLKTLWKKEKMLVTSIFSFSHNVFYPSQKSFFFFESHFFCRLQMLSNLTGLIFCRLV